MSHPVPCSIHRYNVQTRTVQDIKAALWCPTLRLLSVRILYCHCVFHVCPAVIYMHFIAISHRIAEIVHFVSSTGRRTKFEFQYLSWSGPSQPMDYGNKFTCTTRRRSSTKANSMNSCDTESSCGFRNCCLNSDQFGVLIPGSGKLADCVVKVYPFLSWTIRVVRDGNNNRIVGLGRRRGTAQS